MSAVDLGGMQGSLNKMAPASRQWRQAADWARELAQLVDTMQKWLARQLSSALPFQKVCHCRFPYILACPTFNSGAEQMSTSIYQELCSFMQAPCTICLQSVCRFAQQHDIPTISAGIDSLLGLQQCSQPDGNNSSMKAF